MSKGSDEPSRKLLHYHYLEWPAYANATPNSIIQFWRRLREDLLSIQANIEEEIMDGPPVVHCHEGGVRSGAFLAMDEIFSMAEDTEEVDVFGTLKALLSQRRCLLKSPDNLKYIYDVVEDNILCGQTNIPISEILPILQAKSKKDPVTGVNTYQKEHALLSSLIPRFTIGDCAAGHRAENRQKNRNVLIVPPDSSRPYLTTFQNTDSTDYINAVFVDGYRRQNEFICTEWPMNNTMANFWSMVYDHNIKTIIVLNHHNAKTFQKGSYPAFWPVNGNKKSFGHVFCVEETATKSVEGKFASWKLKLTKQDVAPHK